MDRESQGDMSTSTAASRFPRGACLGLALLAVVTAAGCPAPFTRNDYGSPLPANASAEEVVRRVNRNIDSLWAWRSDDVRISGQSLPVHLGGQIAVERPRNFRLTAGILGMDEEADFGSNSDWFWFWVKRAAANGQPSYVYQARHEDVPNSQMLSQIPFQPDWLMEALGVVPIEAQNVTLNLDSRGQIANLISERLSPSGQTVKKVISVDLKRGVVLSHSLYDVNGNLIARARLDNHFRDRATGIIMPHLIALEWPQANLKINLEMRQIEVNPTTIPPRNWQVPKKDPYYPAFDIGARTRKQAPVAGNSFDRAPRGDAIPAGRGVQAAAAAVPDSADGPPAQLGAPSPLAPPTRPTGSSASARGSWPEADGGSEWSQPMQGPAPSSTGAGHVQLGSFGAAPPLPPSAGGPAANSLPSRSASAESPFADPSPDAGSQPPVGPTSVSPGSSSPGSAKGDPFESLPH
jgi:hypothetical protein